MPGIDGTDKATGRVIALIALLVLAGAALRGYIPAAGRVARRPAGGSPASLVLVVLLLGVSLGITAIAFITRVRTHRATAGSIGALSVGAGDRRGRPNWRVVLLGLAVISAWVVIVWLATRLMGRYGFDRLALVPDQDDVPTSDTGASPSGTNPKRPGPPQPHSGGDVFGYLAATTIGMFVLLLAGAVAARTRKRVTEPPGSPAKKRVPSDPAQDPAPNVACLVRAAEGGLATAGDPERDPREAIIGCYATMERELTHVPDAMPQDFDTPTEVLARAVERHALPAGNAARLVALFAEARFSSHLMTERHRQDAIRTLQLVLAELRSS